MAKLIHPGGVPDPQDERDYPFEAFVGADDAIQLPEFYDVEEEFGALNQKDQKLTWSCGAQAVSYYTELLELIESRKLTEMSPHSIYAFTNIGAGYGSITRDNIMRIVGVGIVPESKFSSQPMTEKHMISKEGWTAELEKLAGKYKAKLGVTITDRDNFDLFKVAIFKGHGVVSGLNLSAEGWYVVPIRPPKTSGEKIAGHSMYFKGWGKDQYGDYIKVKDSYPSGDKKLYRDYWISGMVHSAWTLIDLPNEQEVPVNKNVKYFAQARAMSYALYVSILGREPENDLVLDKHAAFLASALLRGDQNAVNAWAKGFVKEITEKYGKPS